MNINQYIPSISAMPYVLRDMVEKVTNVVMNYTDAEIKVIEATNDDSWGPHTKLMADIAKDTFFQSLYIQIMAMLWKRILHEGRTNWRRVYKGCTLLIYLLKHGSPTVLHSTQDRMEELQMLEHINYPTEKGRDTKKNVKIKLRELFLLIENKDSIEDERTKAKKLKMKYVGTSSEDPTFSRFPKSFHSNDVTSLESHISGRWKSTNPGILDRISEVTDRVKEFVIDSKNSFANETDHDSTDDEYDVTKSNRYEPNKSFQEYIASNGFSGKNMQHEINEIDEYEEFQQAENVPKLTDVDSLIDLEKHTPDLLKTGNSLEDLFNLTPKEQSNSLPLQQNDNLLAEFDLMTDSMKAPSQDIETTLIPSNKELDLLDHSFSPFEFDQIAFNNQENNNLLFSMNDFDPLSNFCSIVVNPTLNITPSQPSIESVTKTNVPNTWSDCLHKINIDLDCLTASNEQMTLRNNKKIPMIEMKKI